MTYEHVVHTPVDWTEDYPIHEIKLEFKFKPSFVEYLVIASARAEVINEEVSNIYLDTLKVMVGTTRIHEEDCPLTPKEVKDSMMKYCCGKDLFTCNNCGSADIIEYEFVWLTTLVYHKCVECNNTKLIDWEI